MKSVQLAHGSGGQAMQQLIGDLFMQAFANPWLAEQEDLAEQGIDDLADIEGLTDEKAGELIMAARNICWFGDEA